MKIPKSKGYYWRVGPNFNGETVTQIVEVDNILTNAPDELFYRECGEMGSVYVKEELGTEWYGPIVFMPFETNYEVKDMLIISSPDLPEDQEARI